MLSVAGSQIVAAISRRFPALSQTDAVAAVAAILERMGRSLESGDWIEIRGFGSFGVGARPARAGRNSKTGECVEFPPKKVLRFKPAFELRHRVNGTKVGGLPRGLTLLIVKPTSDGRRQEMRRSSQDDRQ